MRFRGDFKTVLIAILLATASPELSYASGPSSNAVNGFPDEEIASICLKSLREAEASIQAASDLPLDAEGNVDEHRWSLELANHTGLHTDKLRSRYGDFRVEILSQDDLRRRVAIRLPQEGDQVHTLAQVNFLPITDEGVLEVHQQVVEGGSMGATFAAAGYEVEKRDLYVMSTMLSPSMRRQFGVTQEIAYLTFYEFWVKRKDSDEWIQYSRIQETYSPRFVHTPRNPLR